MEKLPPQKQLLWEYYQHLDAKLEYYGELQSKYRLLGSSWLLFGLGAIGYLAKDINTSAKVETLFLFIGIVGIITSFGLYIIYNQDILLYQKFLDAVFIEKRALECANTWLPQASNNVRILLKGKGVKILLQFYLLGFGLTSFIGSLGFILWFKEKNQYRHETLITWGLVLLAVVLLSYFLNRINKKTPTTQEYENTDSLRENRENHYKNLTI